MNEKDFYKFHVANDSNIDEVNFYVDLVAGDVTVYSSRSNRYPNSSDHEKASYFELDYIRYTQELDTQVNGSYYITIEAFSY